MKLNSLNKSFTHLIIICQVSSTGPNKNATEQFKSILTANEAPLLLLPGGLYEFSKSYDEQYKVNWKTKPGFARIIVDEIYSHNKNSNVCVIPFHTKNCENLFFTTSTWYTFSGNLVRKYSKDVKNGNYWKIPLLITMIGLSFGLFVMPLPIKLETYVGKPIKPNENETSEEFGLRVTNELQQLIDFVEKLPIKTHKLNYFRIIKIIICIIVGSIQNLFSFFLIMFLAWILFPIAMIVTFLYSNITKLLGFQKKKSLKSKKIEENVNKNE